MRRALLIGLVFLSGCINICPWCPALRDGKHYPQPVTQATIDRGTALAVCLQGWARTHGYPDADYSVVSFADVRIVGVGDPGVAGPADFVAARESGDTLYIDQRIVTQNGAEYVALQYHELFHVIQQQTGRQLIGANGDIHWSPPWDACHVIRYLIIS